MSVYVATVTNRHKLDDLKEEKFILSVLEGRNTKSSYGKGHVLSGGSREESFLISSSICRLPAVFDAHWRIALSLPSLPPSSCGLFFFLVSQYLPLFSLQKTPVIGFRARIIRCVLILTNSIGKYLIFK